jgi:hypothetical protein
LVGETDFPVPFPLLPPEVLVGVPLVGVVVPLPLLGLLFGLLVFPPVLLAGEALVLPLVGLRGFPFSSQSLPSAFLKVLPLMPLILEPLEVVLEGDDKSLLGDELEPPD